MPAIHAHISLGIKTCSFDLMHRTITIGKAAGCALRLDVPWLEDQHLIIDNSPELVRLKCASPQAWASLSGLDITTDWTLLPSAGRIIVAGPAGEDLLLDLSYPQPMHNAVVLHNESGQVAEYGDDQAATTVTASPLDQQGWLSSSQQEQEACGALDSRPARSSAGRSENAGLLNNREYAVMGVFFGILAIALAAILYNHHVQSAADALAKADTQLVRDYLSQASDLLSKKEYVSAKAALDAAEQLANKYNALGYERNQIADLRGSDEIKFGADGYVAMEGQWLRPKTANAWRLARQRDDPKIALLERKALEARRARLLDDARIACEEALALVEGYPVRPHPREKALRAMLEAIKSDSIAAEMTAKGYVMQNNKWVLPGEQFDFERSARDILKYPGEYLENHPGK
jgi:hypothetical protein